MKHKIISFFSLKLHLKHCVINLSLWLLSLFLSFFYLYMIIFNNHSAITIFAFVMWFTNLIVTTCCFLSELNIIKKKNFRMIPYLTTKNKIALRKGTEEEYQEALKHFYFDYDTNQWLSIKKRFSQMRYY